MELGKIQELLKKNYQTDISKYDQAFLYATIQDRCNQTGIASIEEYALHLVSDHQEADAFHIHLNINYTDFFRNPLSFAQLQNMILPELITKKPDESELRIWSAGCSTGQEPYSIAMIIEDYFKVKSNIPQYRIIATDRSDRQLDFAVKGQYTEESIRNIKVKFIDDYFINENKMYEIDHRLKKHVDFALYDLLETKSFFPKESIYGNFDLVMCCNVLFYYKKEYQDFLMEKLIRSVKNGGYLIVGNAEKHLAKKYDALNATCESSCIFQKIDRGRI